MSTPRWFVLNHDTDAVVRGPYETVEAAAAVREELERNGDDRNLWIVTGIEAIAQRIIRDHGETLRKLAEDD